MTMRCLAVTGANGYIGRRLCALALAEGWDILALARRPSVGREGRFVPFELGRPLPPEAVAEASVLIHLAADLSERLPEQEEVESAVQLQELLAHRRFIFVSSQTASDHAPSRYGRVKWNIEQRVTAAGGIVVRPGQVYGGPELGLFGRLCHWSGLGILPALTPSPRIQPIHLDDLCAALLKLADDASPTKAVNLGSAEPLTFADFVTAIARYRKNRRLVTVPVPAGPLLSCLRLLEKIFPSLERIRAQLASLVYLPVMPTAECTAALGLTLRPLADGLSDWPAAKRKSLIREGFRVLGYLLRRRPERGLVRLYVKACEYQKRAALPQERTSFFALRFQDMPLLRNLAQTLPQALELRRRLDMALMLSEAWPDHADLFIKEETSPAWQAWLELAALGIRAIGFHLAYGLALVVTRATARFRKPRNERV